MRNLLFIFSFFLTATAFSQEDKVFVISDTTLLDKWSTLANDWRYQQGDNMAWANPEFDDSSWNELSNRNLNEAGGRTIADRGEIAWFRKRIKADSSLNDLLVLNIYQEGASEIFLDGERIIQLGKISSNPDEVIYDSGYKQILQLPLIKRKEQVLVVRYQNAQYKLPIIQDSNGYLRISATTLSNANSTDIVKNYIAWSRQWENNFYITLGIAILIFIIFASFYFSFPEETINGYFTLSILFLILSIFAILWSISVAGVTFWIDFFSVIFILLCGQIGLYCLHKILKQPLDIVFKAVIFAGLTSIGFFFLFDPNVIAPIWTLLLYFAIIRLALKSWKYNRIASLLFLSSSIVGLSYLALVTIRRLGLVEFSLEELLPFSFMLFPVSLAIYLGYAFGKRSHELKLNLKRVQNLSKEKESILSKQNETLEQQVKERTASLNMSLENLKATQAQLIQQEKLASLGQLTAGIAHEIKNPLNFVNNFSEVSREMMQEVREEIETVRAYRDRPIPENALDEMSAILDDIESNLEKIHHHGSRADSIVKSMLQHSRGGNNKMEPTDLNALIREYVNLAFHGMRAKKNPINVDIDLQLDPNIKTVSLIGEDFSRVILNLTNNAFDACAELSRSAMRETADQRPAKLTVRTKQEANTIHI